MTVTLTMKHVFTPTSPLKNRATREQVHRVGVVLSFVKRIQRFGIFLSFMLLVPIVIGLGLIIQAGGKNDSSIIVFNIVDTNGFIDKNIIAYYEKESGSTKVYLLDFPAKKSEGSEPFSTLSPTQATLLFRVLVNETVSLPKPDEESSEQNQLPHEYLKKHISHSVATAPHTKLTQRFFWEQVWWWWHLQNLSSTQLAERSFSDLEQWHKYDLQRDIQINTQPCSIAVVNTTSRQGLATRLGEILERSGLFVARLTTTTTNTQNSLLLTNGDEACESVISVLQQLTPNSKGSVVDVIAATRYRASVVLLLGTDLSEMAID